MGRLQVANVPAFPGPRGRIPNFSAVASGSWTLGGWATWPKLPPYCGRDHPDRRGRHRQPPGILAGDLTAERRAEVPILRELGL